MKFIRNFFAFALLFSFAPAAFGAVTFSVSPSVVSNSYSGFITLQIAGITSGDTVVVQKFLDANTNGVVNGSDPLVQQFNLTDNQAGQVIGGIVNSNVPGDLNSTAGAITAQLNFQDGDFAQSLVGKYLYVLSSPAGHFTAITNNFAVTNFAFGQTISGNVVSNTLTGMALSNSIIIVFPAPNSQNNLGQPVAGMVANNAGAYSISLPVGTYHLVPFHTNFVTSVTTSPIIALGSEANITTNLVVTNASASISVVLEDSTNSAVRLPGVFMPFQANGILAIGFSDTNGNCAARVLSGTWSVGSDDSGLTVHGYVGYDNGSNIASGASGVVLPYHHANALFYGSVLTTTGQPLAGADIGSQDTTSNLFQADGYTDPNGNYDVAAIGYGSADPWQIEISENTGILTNYDVATPNDDSFPGTNLVVGAAVLQNFTALAAPNLIFGQITNNSALDMSNIQVSASAQINGVYYYEQAITDVHGYYYINVANGTWTVSVDCNSEDENGLPSNYACPDQQVVAINNNSRFVPFIAIACGGVAIITTSPLPYGETNAAYFQTLQASSCNDNFSWQQTGGTLPPGLSLDGSGDVFGTPTTPGVYSFSVQATDGNNDTGNGTFSLTISNGVSLTTTALPAGTNGFNYSQQLNATNGTPPYSWSLLSGSTPPTLSLSSTGLLSGPVTASGTYNFAVQVTDSLQATATESYSLVMDSTNIPTLSAGTAAGQIIVLWPASAGTNFTLQMTTNLNNPNWVPATNGVLQNAYLFTNSSPQVFYRLQ